MNLIKRVLPIIVIVGILVWAGCKKDDEKTLTAAFSYELTENPGEVQFTNQSSHAEIFTWNFGDGFSNTMENPAHTYDINDTYIVSLQVGGLGTTASVQDTIVVNNIP